MATNKLWRILSRFNPSTRVWAPVMSSRNTQNQVPHRLSIISWNLDAFSSRSVSRAKLILGHILEGQKSPDIIFFQEVTREVRVSLLNDAKIREVFLATDAEDQASFEKVPFATMALLSKARFASSLDSEGDVIERGMKLMLGRVFRVILPSKYGRDALCVDIIHPTTPGTVFRLINVHLDSLEDALHYRAQQIKILADVLREPGCGGGLIAGDFNAISLEDNVLIDKNKLVDAWIALRGREDPGGATWGVGVARRDGLGQGRLDKVVTMDIKAKEMEILRPGFIEVPVPGEKSLSIPWSDHCGLRCTFTV